MPLAPGTLEQSHGFALRETVGEGGASMTASWRRMPAGTAPAVPAPWDGARTERLRFGRGDALPNNPRVPVVLMRGVLSGAGVSGIKALYEANGWFRVWDWSVFDYHHYHPDAHEALTVAAGRARLTLGGPEGQPVEVQAGDAMALPAGTGHCLVECDGGFRGVGGYPEGQEGRTIVEAAPGRGAADGPRVDRVPPPETCPVYGRGESPVLDAFADPP